MNQIQELEQQLIKAKEEEKLNSLKKECEQVRKEYEGKAFGSREFERAAKSSSDSAIFIKKIYLGERSSSGKYGILGDIWSVRLTRYDGNYKFSQNHYNYSRSRDEESSLTNDRTNVSWNVYQMFPHLKKEISSDKFMELWNACKEHEVVLTEPFSKAFGADYQELIRMGDSGRDTHIAEAIKKLKLDIIDVQTEYPKEWNEIRYSDLPMFQNNKYLPRAYAKQVLEYQISLWQEDIRKGWNSQRMINALHRRIEVVQGLINKL